MPAGRWLNAVAFHARRRGFHPRRDWHTCARRMPPDWIGRLSISRSVKRMNLVHCCAVIEPELSARARHRFFNNFFFRRMPTANAEGSIGKVSARHVSRLPSARHGPSAFAVGMRRDIKKNRRSSASTTSDIAKCEHAVGACVGGGVNSKTGAKVGRKVGACGISIITS